MTIKERVYEFVKSEGLTIKEFEERCGLSNGYVSSMRKGFGLEKLENVLTEFPDLSRDWLLYGEGEMLKSGAVVGGNGIAVSGNNVKTGSVSVVGGEAAALREKVKMMQALLEEKDKLLEEKERNIADKERMIKILMER